MKRLIAALGIFILILAQVPAYGEYSLGPATFSAFGTLGGAWLSNPHVDLLHDTQPTGPGMTHDIDTGFDSRVGAQLNIALTPTTLVTAQSVLERLSDNQYLPRLTQLNIRQEVFDAMAVRIGRIQSPAFLASDYRLANFSNPWARTPGVVYNIYPLTHLDSAEFTYKFDTGLGTLALNTGYGWLQYPAPIFPQGKMSTANLNLEDVYYSNINLENGPWRFKVSWLQARTTVHVSDIDQFIDMIMPMDASAAWAMRPNNHVGQLFSAGICYDSQNWLLMAEWATTLSKHAYAFADRHGGYLTAGYHIGRWMPHLTVGYQATFDRRVHSQNPQLDRLIADSLMKPQRTDYQTLAVGLNYSPFDSVVVRAQVDLIQPMGNSWGPYAQRAMKPPSHPDLDSLFSLSLDFVY